MTGGVGADDFDFNAVAEIGNGATRDVITDFVHLTDDIDLSTIDANGAAAGNTAFSFLAAQGAAFTGVAGSCAGPAGLPTTDPYVVKATSTATAVADFQIRADRSEDADGGGFHSVGAALRAFDSCRVGAPPRTTRWVRIDKAHSEHNESAFTLIVLQNSR